MRPKEFENLYKYCVELFGKERIKNENLSNPDGIEIIVDLSGLKDSPAKQVNLALYRGGRPMSFMHIDDFAFEYDADEKKALLEMQTYLEALKRGKVYISSKNILGLKFSKHLSIKAH